MSRLLRYLVYTLLTALVLTASTGTAQQGAKGGEWRSYAGDAGSSRYAPHDQINRDNVKTLQVAWSWKFDNFGGATSETTPIRIFFLIRHLLDEAVQLHRSRCAMRAR